MAECRRGCGGRLGTTGRADDRTVARDGPRNGPADGARPANVLAVGARRRALGLDAGDAVRACTTSRSCGSSAARRMRRRPRRSRAATTSRFNAAMAPMLMARRSARARATSCATSPRTSHRIGGPDGSPVRCPIPGLERRSLSGHCEVGRPARRPPRHGREPVVRRARARLRALGRKGPPGRARRARTCRSRSASSPSPGTSSCGRARAAGAAAADVLARRRGHAYDPAVVDASWSRGGEQWLAELGDDPCVAGARRRAGTAC